MSAPDGPVTVPVERFNKMCQDVLAMAEIEARELTRQGNVSAANERLDRGVRHVAEIRAAVAAQQQAPPPPPAAPAPAAPPPLPAIPTQQAPGESLGSFVVRRAEAVRLHALAAPQPPDPRLDPTQKYGFGFRRR